MTETAKLIELLRRYLAEHGQRTSGQAINGTCLCSLCSAARKLLA